MSRIKPLDQAALGERQRQVYAEIAGPRGGVVRGPFAIWLASNPELADRANRLGNALRSEGRLDKRLFELMVLVIARHWTAQYEWWVHAAHGREVGLSAAVISAIAERRPPKFDKPDEELVFTAITQLVEQKKISQPVYDRLIAAFGEPLVIELISAAGFYAMVAMMLVAFEAPVPDATKPLTD